MEWLTHKKLNDRLDNIEATLGKISPQLEKIAPIVEEYHAKRVVSSLWLNRLKYLAVIIGVLIGTSRLINSAGPEAIQAKMITKPIAEVNKAQ